jgi:hypothetical protein
MELQPVNLSNGTKAMSRHGFTQQRCEPGKRSGQHRVRKQFKRLRYRGIHRNIRGTGD